MSNSVFKKMIMTYLAVILISFIIFALLLINMLEDYYFEKRTEALINEGQKLNNSVINYLNGEVSYERLSVELESIERFLNSKIWVVDNKGYIYGVSNKSQEEWIGKQVSTGDIISVLNGEIITNRGGYDEVFKGPVLTVGVPIIINGNVKNAVFMHSPIYEVEETIKEILKLILTSITIALGISMMLIYFTSQRISKPLMEMNKITKVIASGEFQKRLDIVSDDEIGQLAQSFNNMAGELEKLEEMRKGFIADVSHELRSPLTVIKGYIKGLMEDEIDNDKKAMYVDIIYEETERLTELINNLLDLSKMESGSYPLNIAEFNINELLRRNIIKFGNKLEEKNIEVEVQFKEEPLLVKAEKESISQVVSNIIDNAIKFMGDNDNLSIRTYIKNKKAHISIEDSGLGIPKEELNDIWKRFHKGDKSRSRQVKGTGLGLSIVKEIIKNHNENIWVESEINKGTKFTFTLELVKPKAK